MSIYNRENQYINLLAQKPHSVKELSEKLFISEPTVRRDITLLQKKEILTRKRGIVTLKTNSPDQRIPLFIRHLEQNEEKSDSALSSFSNRFSLRRSSSASSLIAWYSAKPIISKKPIWNLHYGTHTIPYSSRGKHSPLSTMMETVFAFTRGCTNWYSFTIISLCFPLYFLKR